MRQILRAVLLSSIFMLNVNACEFGYNSVNCQIVAHCFGDIYFRYEDFKNENPGFNCDDLRDNNKLFYDLQNSNKGLEIHVVYKYSSFIGIPQTIPPNTNYYYQFIHIVELILNENDYKETPAILQMDNLRSISLVNNQLTEAKLFNEHSLNALEDLNLSYNTINSILVDTDKFVYTGLKTLNISNNYLVNLPDAILDHFPDLRKLDLSNNFIDTLGFMTFEGIKQLQILNLNNNRISQLSLALLRFKQLEELYLANNKLTHMTVRDFEMFDKLRILDLSNNLVTNIEIHTLRNMLMLNEFDISYNKLEILEQDVIAHVVHLQIINLSNNLLKNIPELLFKNNNLSYVSLQGNELQGSIEKGTFEGLELVSELDLSSQQFTTLKDYAFFGLRNLITLLLNNNCLETISKKAFKSLHRLNQLDLANNKITVIEFENDDLSSLNYLSLKNNFITNINPENFYGLLALNSIDISNNSITHLVKDSFKSLNGLVNFDISKNPLFGPLEGDTFEGLNSLPILDISHTLLTIIKNNSFSGMSQLKNLNISHCKIQELEYNSFMNTYSINVLDMSFNELSCFDVNTTHLANLQTLFLNNNFILSMTSTIFKGLFRLSNIVMSHNLVQIISNDVFADQNDMRHLDLSFNSKLKLNMTIVKKAHHLNKLLLSGIQEQFNFVEVIDNNLLDLVACYGNIKNISSLELRNYKLLNNLDLSHNNVTKIEAGNFRGLSELRNINLSFNKISFLQPGSFKDNTMLQTLNVSHNNISSVSYGFFRGLIYLNIIDLSFNHITSLKSERFYEVQSLTLLVADHNDIDYIGAEEFSGTNLNTLSIGDNPLPCENLFKIKKDSDNGIRFTVTAINLDHESENVEGVTCNRKIEHFYEYQAPVKVNMSDRFLIDFRHFLFNISKISEKSEIVMENINDVLKNVTHKEFKPRNEASEFNNKLDIVASFMNITKQMHNEQMSNDNLINRQINKTNSLLDKILQLQLTRSDTGQSTIPAQNHNSELNKIKNDSKDTLAYVNNKLFELDSKIRAIVSRLDNGTRYTSSKEILTTSSPKKYQLLASSQIPESRSPLFTETCVALILVILIGFILYSLFKTKVFMRTRRSMSTREIASSMESSNL